MAINRLGSSQRATFVFVERDGTRSTRTISSEKETILDDYQNLPGTMLVANSHGARTIIPQNNFYAMIHMWGAGAGVHSNANSSQSGGYGGYSWGILKMRAGIPYTIITGQKGSLNNANVSTVGVAQGGRAYGGGGAGSTSGCGGGGLSGIFYNAANHAGPNASVWPPTGVSQASALMIAGGGGGGGHAANANSGAAGGGGGTHGNYAANTGRSGQTGSGNVWSTNHGGQVGSALQGGSANVNPGGTSYIGGGGGGWFGGPSGSHHTVHYTGGGGGSGHYVNTYSNGGNTALVNEIVFAETEMAPMGHGSRFDHTLPARSNWYHPAGIYARRTSDFIYPTAANNYTNPYNLGAGYGSNNHDNFTTDGTVALVYPNPKIISPFIENANTLF